MEGKSPLLLVILDGWGYTPNNDHNAITKAHAPNWKHWWKTKPHLLLEASGNAVGLPEGQMGNSEVGHMHIGAGRRVPQDFTRINDAIRDGSFYTNPVFIETIQRLKQSGNTLHVMGLISPGGVHSHQDHLFAFLDVCRRQNFSDVALHLFLDGRDTPPKSALESLKKLEDFLDKYPVATIASITGRYYAMDRDHRWERLFPVYKLLTEGKSDNYFNDIHQALSTFYDQTITDEFIPPTRIGEGQSIVNGDAVFFFNFRADRARQLTAALIDSQFSGFERVVNPELSAFISMTQYAKNLPTTMAYPPIELKNTLGEVLAKNGLAQLRIAETEKYAHVTFFLNGGNEQVFPEEDRILIPSPKISTYDLQPEMSAPELTLALIDAIKSNAYDVIICNYANADMVGHSGDIDATMSAIACLDKCLGEVWEQVQAKSGMMLVTADHGNAEMMYDPKTQQAHTAHTSNKVPLLFLGKDWHFSAKTGSLVDIAPTLLALIGITPPDEMTGKILMVQNNE